jgi:hypothetical protein
MSESKVLYRVKIYESERGWGQKLDEVKYFESKEEAMAFIDKYNSKNNKNVTPDWYMFARYAGV